MTDEFAKAGPLAGILVLDATRMLPGAALARTLLDLGARVVKIEDPSYGDPLRLSPPLVDGTGAGFRALFAGAESVSLDLRQPAHAAALGRLATHADVLAESFRPGTLARWGLDPARLAALNPSLVVCSLSSYGQQEARRVGHDLNFVAESGLLALLGAEGVPRVQLADVTAGLVACSSILAALVERARTGRGAVLDRPLSGATAPLLLLARAEAAAGGGGLADRVLAGRCPAYRIYTCADGERVAVGALEPKFWAELARAMGLEELAGDGLRTDEAGAEAARRAAERFAERPSADWLALAEERSLPLTRVRPSVEPLRPAATAPGLGEHTDAVLGELGISLG